MSDIASIPLTRRSVVLGAALGGLALTLKSRGMGTMAQQATDLSQLGFESIDLTVTPDGYSGVPETLAAGRYLVNLTADAGLPADNGPIPAAFMSPKIGNDAVLSLLGDQSSPVADEESAPPTWYYESVLAGGPTAMPGGTGSAVIDLLPGEWLVWADNPAIPLKPAAFTVTGDVPADVTTPSADITFTLVDFDITVDGNLKAGSHILEFTNSGSEPHFVYGGKVPDGTTKDDVAALLNSDMMGTPVAGGLQESDLQPLFNTVTQSIGTSQWVTLNLDAGTYAAMCFFPTAGTGIPHAFHGMYTVFQVTA